MNKKQLLLLFLILFIFLLASSCKKNVENKIDGTWKMVNTGRFYLVSSDTIEHWEFKNGNLIKYTTIGGAIVSNPPSFSGEYSIKIKVLKRILKISNTNSFNDCDWTIEKLSKKYLTIYTTTYGGSPGGQEYREFTKE
jgi:hypothetical protein